MKPGPAALWRDGDLITHFLQLSQRLVDLGVTVLPAKLADVIEEALIERLSPPSDLGDQGGPGSLIRSRLL